MTHSASIAGEGSSRRQFLLGGAAVVAGAVLLSREVAPDASGLELLADSEGPRIPIAYLEGSDGASSLADAFALGATSAVPAIGLAGSDVPAAHATVRGFADPSHTALGLDAVLLDGLVPSPAQRRETLPFFAFTHRSGAASQATGTGRLHLRRDERLPLGFRMATTSLGVAATATHVFTRRTSRQLPTLRPGVYLLGLEPGMFASPFTVPPVGAAAWSALPSVVLAVGAA